MVKLLGMISVVASSVILGFVMANELNERCRMLREICQGAIHIKTDLEYRAPDISECFKMRGRIFEKAEKYIVNDLIMPKEALVKAISETKCLTKEDKEVLSTYADNLEIEDVGGQIANVVWLIENLRERIRDAENEYLSKGRLYRSGGLLAGVGFLILTL